LSPTTLHAFEAATGIPVVETYGMTEAASQICANPLGPARKIGSVGPALGVALRIRSLEADDSGAVSPGVVGHVEIRGASVIERYDALGYEDRVDSEGWLRTGDLGYLDEDDYLFLVGRSDDVINRGGEKIFPRDIEEVVLALESVRGAAVVGEPDEVYGHVPALYVELVQGIGDGPDDLDQLITTLRDVLTTSLHRSRRPATISVVKALPVHATGKITRRLLGTDAVPVLWRESLT
jgi:acyl-CoA synthetase (AMP-forming)/AMP-acid ligase II